MDAGGLCRCAQPVAGTTASQLCKEIRSPDQEAGDQKPGERKMDGGTRKTQSEAGTGGARSVLPEWVSGSLGTRVQGSGVSTHGRGRPEAGCLPIFAFISNRKVFFFPFAFIQSSHMHEFSRAHAHPDRVKWDSEGQVLS